MKNLVTWMFLLSIAVGGSLWLSPDLPAKLGLAKSDHELVLRAFQDRESNLIVETDAQVVLVLPDHVDLTGQFQQFRVELENGHTLLVSNDLSRSPGVPVKPGSEIRIRGEYDWNSRGGVIHWAHGDPSGRREGGWIEHGGETYR